MQAPLHRQQAYIFINSTYHYTVETDYDSKKKMFVQNVSA